MPKIYSILDPFDTKQLSVGNPITKNGSHFMKIQASNSPLYFQAPKCTVKTGFVTSGKKMFCDFVFSNEDDEFLSWLESLEETARGILYQNRAKWFETELDEHDIENSMTSPYKMYKSGKYYIIRTNVPNTLGKCDLKIYGENEQETDPDQIKDGTPVLVIFEFKGIRCSVRSFQFEVELKQMLVVEPDNLFEKCIIRPSRGPDPAPAPENLEESIQTLHATEEVIPEPEPEPEPEPKEQNANDPEICEIEFPLEELDKSPPLKLKNRNDVYYKLYKEAKAKAREAKQIAIANYLEAKRIKTTFLFDDADEDSDLEELDKESSFL